MIFTEREPRGDLSTHSATISLNLLVQGLGVGGGGRDVGVTGSLVRAGGELELVGSLQVGITGTLVGVVVLLKIEQQREHFWKTGRELTEQKSDEVVTCSTTTENNIGTPRVV